MKPTFVLTSATMAWLLLLSFAAAATGSITEEGFGYVAETDVSQMYVILRCTFF